MKVLNQWTVRACVLIALLSLAAGCGLKRKPYENPISKDTQQPDKVLYDKAISDVEHGRYEIARLTLQTLMNTYDTSEYMAKAKLLYADSWYREGGAHALAQAEAEYKDFILFYPTMQESAEAQEKVCMIHFKQMEKADRDMSQALRAEDECRNVLVQFPNSKFAPEAQQKLREIQEVIAQGEFKRGYFYYHKGSNPAAAARLQALVNQYPLFSQADEANYLLAEAYSKMGPRFRQQAGEAYARIVREYPLSPLVPDATKELQKLELPVPEPDQVAYARMKYEMENREKMGPLGKVMDIFKKGPDVSAAAKSGQPAMTSLRPITPASVPPAALLGGGSQSGGFKGDVSAATVVETGPPAEGGTAAATPAAPAAGTEQGSATPDPNAPPSPTTLRPGDLPSNHTAPPKKQQKKQKKPSTTTPAAAPAAAPASAPATEPAAPPAGTTSGDGK
jgi:outer membrane protein assembly factor BamD